MKTITEAQLRPDPTSALDQVSAGETLVVLRHRRPVAKLVPLGDDASLRMVPARKTGPSSLAGRPRTGLHPHEDTEMLLADMGRDW